MLDAVTIDQLRMLVAVADEGSFTRAARRVQRAQSAVSQAIQTLEFLLDLELFDRSGYRPVLTNEGRAVVADARGVIERATALRARARSLAGGVEAHVRLAVTLLAPIDRVADALSGLDDAFPATELDLVVSEAGGPLEAVTTEREGARADLGVVGAFNLRGPSADAVEAMELGRVAITAVAAPDHPLGERAAAGEPIGREHLKGERQLASASARGVATADPLSARVWPVADQGVRRALLLRGFGWGVVPAHVVQADLDDGALVPLDLAFPGAAPAHETLLAIHRRNTPPGPAGRWMIEAMRAALGNGTE